MKLCVVLVLFLAACGPTERERRMAEIKKLEAEIAAGAPADQASPGQRYNTETKGERLQWLKTLEEMEKR